MSEFISSIKQEEYLDKLRRLKQTEQDMKLFADEMTQTYKKQESQVQKLDKEIKQFNEDLRLQEMQLSKQEKAQAASLKIVREQEEELRQVKEKLEKETALNK